MSVSVPKSAELQANPYPDLGFLTQAVSASYGSPSMLLMRNGRFYPTLCGECECVCVCSSLSLSRPLLLRFLGSCSGCLPSLSTGHARNLRRRNLRSRWGRASLTVQG